MSRELNAELADDISRWFRDSADAIGDLDEECASATADAASITALALRTGGKLLAFGNGGSAADAQHLAAELVGRFARDRIGLPAIALTADSSVITAIANDYSFEHIFARQIDALGSAGDIALAISTSGASRNVLLGIQAASAKGLKTIGLMGKRGSPLADSVEISIVVSAEETARVQECHTVIEHAFCDAVERLVLRRDQGPDREGLSSEGVGSEH
jgi:phosphoheptose isomerase